MNIYEVGILSALLSIFINYCIGKPGSQFSPYEIFSFYTVWLSKRRLKKVGLLDNYLTQLAENCKGKKVYQIKEIEKEFAAMVYNAAEPYFTWERMSGMCSVCTGFWVSLITGICFTQNFVYLVAIILISHISIRILNKII